MKNVYIPKGQAIRVQNANMVSPEKVLDMVQSFFGVTMEYLSMKSKVTSVVYPRQVSQWLLWTYTNLPKRAIGRLFNQNDSTSCKYSVKAIENYIATDVNVKKQITELEAKLKDDGNPEQSC